MIFFSYDNDNSPHQIKVKPFSNKISFIKVVKLLKRSINKIYYRNKKIVSCNNYYI